ncbi:asparaginase [Microbaculum marinum]|uniref:Asparaginase n=1 Tax=Microbaculum marinum TaxID=1764581 RepID=A0AAW9RPP7_9HYPH
MSSSYDIDRTSPDPAANPVVVEVTRGPLVESFHRGRLAIFDAGDDLVFSAGDVSAPVYPRSAIKALQALPLVEDGAADAFGFSDAEIALTCSSHNGEAGHVAAARSMLAKAGVDESWLECGPQDPARDADRIALAEAGASPGPIHNNCSGKHAGMLALARHMGVDPRGYSRPDHPVQHRVRQTMSEMAGVDLTADLCGIDGCSLPTWAAPLTAWARAFALLATGGRLAENRRTALERIRAACGAHPFMVAGTGRFCTLVMERAGSAAFVKTGAEGVFCAAFPGTGLGIALKIDDGATRASEVLMAEVILRGAGLPAEAAARIAGLARPSVLNRIGARVGEIRVAEGISDALADAVR